MSLSFGEPVGIKIIVAVYVAEDVMLKFNILLIVRQYSGDKTQ